MSGLENFARAWAAWLLVPIPEFRLAPSEPRAARRLLGSIKKTPSFSGGGGGLTECICWKEIGEFSTSIY